jgi:hypothetical protein
VQPARTDRGVGGVGDRGERLEHRVPAVELSGPPVSAGHAQDDVVGVELLARAAVIALEGVGVPPEDLAVGWIHGAGAAEQLQRLGAGHTGHNATSAGT